MNRELLIIAVTTPNFFKEEAEKINLILNNKDAHYIHIRKPGSSIYETDRLISNINPKFHPFLKLHDHFELLDKYNLGGIHLNSRNKKIHPRAKSLSISLHDINEIEGKERYDYFFISPVFDSISKEGYKASFDLKQLSQKIRGKKAIALGGVTPDKFTLLRSLGFYGAALLGHFFPPTSPSSNSPQTPKP